MKPAIYEPAITQWVAVARDLVREVHEGEEAARQQEKKLGETREAARMRRIELGRFLASIKDKIKHGGWGEFLEAIEVDRTSAWRYMVEAGAVFQERELKQMGVQVGEVTLPDTPHAVDGEVPADVDVDVDVRDLTDADEVEIDRDTWCTPKWITDALGHVDLDPCANERSHVQAGSTFRLDREQDGLELAEAVGRDWQVFINPPYSDVTPWIRAYGHTRFCFLLKLDPSTKWFAELLAISALVLIPKGTRVQFEAPEGVPPDMSKANPFPHALFFARADDAPLALVERCFVWRIERAT